MRGLLKAVVDAYQRDATQTHYDSWTLTRWRAGANGLVYRAEHDNPEQHPLAVKLSRHDVRDRSGREYAAMKALWESGVDDVCAYPLLLVHNAPYLPGDVLVSQWVPGERLEKPFDADDLDHWRTLLYTFARAHALTPQRTPVNIPNAVLYVRHPANLIAHIEDRVNLLPEGRIGHLHRDHINRAMARMLRRLTLHWPLPAPVGLILGDPNPANIIMHNGALRLVDWANAGWSDPAMDIADMLGQPAYVHLSDDHRAWIRETYAHLSGDPTAATRVQVYEIMMNVFWLVNFSRYVMQPRRPAFQGSTIYAMTHFQEHQALYWERVRTLLNL